MQRNDEDHVVGGSIDLQIRHVKGLGNRHAIQRLSEELSKASAIDDRRSQMSLTEILAASRVVVAVGQHRRLGAAGWIRCNGEYNCKKDSGKLR